MSIKYERIVWINKEMRANRYPNAHKVQEHFELRNVRTAYDDRKFMIDRLGAPIGYDNFHEGWYYTESNFSLPAFMLTKTEVISFLLGEELLKRYMGTAFEQPLRMALEKIKQYMPDNIGYDAQQEATSFAFTGGATIQVNPDILVELHHAMTSKHQVEILYYSASSGESSRRMVDPYHLHNIRGDWYLIAFCHSRDEVRDFLVGRIKEMKVLPSEFVMGHGFSLKDYLGKGFLAERGTETTEVVIKFDEYQARWIRERQWHPSQQIQELPSGELIFRLNVGGLQEVKRWIMGYGPHAEVLQPESLRAQFKEEAQKMKKIYEKSYE
jgi:predicted DNA-binding transcriptional regulator YafY